jgi:hypothetical protein
LALRLGVTGWSFAIDTEARKVKKWKLMRQPSRWAWYGQDLRNVVIKDAVAAGFAGKFRSAFLPNPAVALLRPTFPY